jgi:hypothetical protein
LGLLALILLLEFVVLPVGLTVWIFWLERNDDD